MKTATVATPVKTEAQEKADQQIQKKGKSLGRTFNIIKKGAEISGLSFSLISAVIALAILSFAIAPVEAATFTAVAIAGLVTSTIAAIAAATALILKIPAIKKKIKEKDDLSYEKEHQDDLDQKKTAEQVAKEEKILDLSPEDQEVLKQLNAAFEQKKETEHKLSNIEKQLVSLNKNDSTEPNAAAQIENLQKEKAALQQTLANLQDHFKQMIKSTDNKEEVEKEKEKEIPQATDVQPEAQQPHSPRGEVDGFQVIGN